MNTEINTKIKVIVVDDEPIIRMDLVDMLEKLGYDVIGEASDGYEIIELCNQLKPDVVVMDITMPGLDGMSASKVISQYNPEIAIIILTAFSEREYIDKAKKNNISCYLMKPIEERLLVPNIELAVARNKELLEQKQEAANAKAQLENRKVVDKAKGLLIKNRGISEEEAFEYIRSVSKRRNMAMRKVADVILIKYGV